MDCPEGVTLGPDLVWAHGPEDAVLAWLKGLGAGSMPMRGASWPVAERAGLACPPKRFVCGAIGVWDVPGGVVLVAPCWREPGLAPDHRTAEWAAPLARLLGGDS